MSREPTEVMAVKHFENAQGVVISLDGDGKKGKFIGRQHIVSIHETGQQTNANDRNGHPCRLPIVNLSMPEWKAYKEGFI